MTILIVSDLGKYFGAGPVFRFVSFTVSQGEKVCVVGRNGQGKTTLLRIIAGELEPDEGRFAVVGKKGIGYLSQDPPAFQGTVLEEVLASRRDILELAARMGAIEQKMAHLHDDARRRAGEGEDSSVEGEDLAGGGQDLAAEDGDSAGLHAGERLMEEYARVTARFEAADGYRLEHRAKAILGGVGFTPDAFHKVPDVLSGGERMRLALAKLLLAQPDLLLLDEPSDHLDVKGVEWLEAFLKDYPGAVLMVSHDRYFIDRVADKVLELEGGEGKLYPGNYSAYLARREEERRTQGEAYRRQQELIARTRAFIQKWKATPTRKAQAQSREKMLERLVTVEKPRRAKRAMGIRFDLGRESGEEVLQVTGLGKSFPLPGSPGDGAGPDADHGGEDPRARVLFRGFTWQVRRGDRVALVGPNGCGKTTLLRCLSGIDREFDGEVRIGHHVVTAYFSQGLDDLDDESTVLEEVTALGLTNQEARDLLGRFLFSGEVVEKKVCVLSGGERNRLMLAKLVVSRANLIFLDEPTNHLDMASREALEDAARDFPGTLIFASHDRFFIDRLATHLWLFQDGRIRVFRGNYSDYRRKVEAGEAVVFEDDLPSFALRTDKAGAAGGAVARTRPDPSPGPRSERGGQGRPRAPGVDPPREGGQGRARMAAGAPPEDAQRRALQAEILRLEDEIEALEKRRGELLELFKDPASYENPETLPSKEFGRVEKDLAALYERWESMVRLATEAEDTAVDRRNGGQRGRSQTAAGPADREGR
ncbi:MAG: ABC-F family ATP-binding cassette domain-containing protein [Bacillota bacterium]|nr:ABC-F family ATP-binding cassette domain-containing protein [Bacillota bacterium]